MLTNQQATEHVKGYTLRVYGQPIEKCNPNQLDSVWCELAGQEHTKPCSLVGRIDQETGEVYFIIEADGDHSPEFDDYEEAFALYQDTLKKFN